MCVAMLPLLTLSASALDGQLDIFDSFSGREGDIDFEKVILAADTVTDMVSVCFSAILGNPFLCVVVAAGLIGVGVRVWLSARRASH